MQNGKTLLRQGFFGLTDFQPGCPGRPRFPVVILQPYIASIRSASYQAFRTTRRPVRVDYPLRHNAEQAPNRRRERHRENTPERDACRAPYHGCATGSSRDGTERGEEYKGCDGHNRDLS